MWERFFNKLKSVGSSFWVVPTIFVLLAIILAFVALELDRRVFSDIQNDFFWLFGGRSDAARDLLSAIAGSLITVISIAFSITIIAIQQASTQYSPRVLRRFTEDRGNQIVLGMYLATFTYSLLVLRDIRSSEIGATSDGRFVPAFSVWIALFLALVSVALLVYFINHITHLIQVSSMLAGIRNDLGKQLKKLYPNELSNGDDRKQVSSYAQHAQFFEQRQQSVKSEIRIKEEGYLQVVNLPGIIKLTQDCHAVWITRAIGDHLIVGTVVANLWSDQPIPEATRAEFCKNLIVGSRRNIPQDPLFGIRQIVDIAVKALSPGINDPTTAEQCIAELKGVVSDLLTKDIPPALNKESGIQFLVNRPGFSDYVEKSFAQIIRNAERSYEVLMYLLTAIEGLIDITKNDHRLEVLKEQIRGILEILEIATGLTKKDKDALAKEARRILNAPTHIESFQEVSSATTA